MASETTFDHWKVIFLMSKSEKKGPETMKPLLRHSIAQHGLKTVVRSNFRPEISSSVFGQTRLLLLYITNIFCRMFHAILPVAPSPSLKQFDQTGPVSNQWMDQTWWHFG